MVKDFFFILKMLGLTALVIFVLQVRVGGKSLDDHFDGWLKSSIAVDYMQEAIDGGIALTKAGYKKADEGIHVLMAKLTRRHKKEERGIGFHLRRYNESDDGSVDETPQAHAQSHVGLGSSRAR